jgi:hypothetical protein
MRISRKVEVRAKTEVEVKTNKKRLGKRNDGG